MASAAGIDVSDDLRDGLIPRDELPIIKHLERNLRANEDFCSARWKVAEENHRFTYGREHQWDARTYKERQDTDRPTFSMNDVALAVHALSGREMTARFEGSYLARSAEDQPLNNALREVYRKVRENTHAQHVESEAFRDLIITNYGVTEWSHVFEGQPRGQTVVKNRNLWEMMWDSAAEGPNLLDRSWDAWGGWMPVDEYLMMFPGQREELKANLAQDKLGWLSPDHEKTTRWPWLHRSANRYYKDKQREIFAVDYEWREREPCYFTEVPPGLAWLTTEKAPKGHPATERVIAAWQQAAAAAQQGMGPDPGPPPAPKAMVLGVDEIDGYLESFARWAFENGLPAEPEMLGPQDGWYRWSYRRAYIVGRRVVKKWTLPGQRFMRQFMVGYNFKQPDGSVRFGPVDLMHDPQAYKNAIYSMTTSLVQRSQKGGLYTWPGLFEDENDLAKRAAAPFPILRLKQAPRDISMLQALSIPVATFPTGVDRILDLADQAIWRPLGMSPATLGHLEDPRRVSGVVFERLANQGDVVMSQHYDSLRLMRKEAALLFLDLLPAFYEAEDLREIVGPDKAGFIPDKEEWAERFARDVIVEEVAVSKSEKEKAWEYGSRQGTWEKMVQSGVMPAWLFAKMMPEGWISEEDRAEWIAWLRQKEAMMNAGGGASPAA